MGKDKLYFFTFISISIIYLIVSSFGINYSTKISVNLVVESLLESSKREVKEISKLMQLQAENDIKKKILISNLQEAIEDAETGITFTTVFDWSGKIVCHPQVSKINEEINASQTLSKIVEDGGNINAVYDLIMEFKKDRKTSIDIQHSEILYKSPVKNSDLIIASNINLNKLLVRVNKLKVRLYSIFIFMGAIIILISFFMIRFISSFYEKKLEEKNSGLESDIVNLTKLNLGVLAYQQKVINEEKQTSEKRPSSQENNTPEEITQNSKTRILTYIRNELIPTPTQDISYIFTENTITYVMCRDGKRSISNASLDEIYHDLDTSLFFRANRQHIIRITAIEKIIKYGNSQLKILIQNSDIEIIISKNKAAEFRKWLNI